MTGEEVRVAIDMNNKTIEDALIRDSFVLNESIMHIMALNDTIRGICPHEDDDLGFCKYCDLILK